ncbi:MAG: cysteine desulfurase [Desulfobacteraceae bacterium]|nr:cysteine desulfurase [Pseudomonadota bacterium]MBU4464022.1 cysteine desulfurase [Pseudomonadota bacterium]MCG2754763.1 cysteine desulfurase [Desulfobacteraceae bacterium]
MIYLDYNATTPIDSDVAAAMMPFIKEEFGNPSSSYSLGIRAKQALEKARGQVARLLGCESREIVFTSGGSESNNMVLKGVALSLRSKGRHIITTAIEHPAIFNPAIFLMENGWDVTFLPVDKYGLLDPDEVKKAIRKDTVLISVMHANNETGTIQPVQEIGRLSREHGIFFHTDAAQSVGKIKTDVNDLCVDFLTIAGHKLYAPKGIGALYIRNGIEIVPLIHGGGQEKGRRAGTENVILNVALGAACELAGKHLEDYTARIISLRDRFHDKIVKKVPEVVLNGHPENRLPNTLNLSFPGLIGSEILRGIPDLCASTGSACKDRSVTISHVLAAMGVSREIGMGAVRLTLGRPTTEEEVDQAAEWIIKAVKSGSRD